MKLKRTGPKTRPSIDFNLPASMAPATLNASFLIPIIECFNDLLWKSKLVLLFKNRFTVFHNTLLIVPTHLLCRELTPKLPCQIDGYR